MIDPAYSNGKWVIVFYDPGKEHRHWWDIFTRPGFRHCFAIRYLVEADSWVIVDWSSQGLYVNFMTKPFVDAMIIGVNDCGGSFLEYDVGGMLGRRAWPAGPGYCVTAMKELVGIRDIRIVTPWQLYCALLHRGAKVIFGLQTSEVQQNGKVVQLAKSAGTGSGVGQAAQG